MFIELNITQIQVYIPVDNSQYFSIEASTIH